MYFRTIALVVASLVLTTHMAPISQRATGKDILKLLTSLRNSRDDHKVLAALFQNGDAHIEDLISALRRPERNINVPAQIVIRYLGNQKGIKALESWYGEQTEIVRSGPVPIPLIEADYQWISREHLRDLESSYIYALALDGSPKAQTVLNRVLESYDEDRYAGTAAGEALTRVKTEPPRKFLRGKSDLAQLVLKHAFFVDPRSRRYASAHLLGLNGTKDKALVEVHVDRGTLSEEWYHVVISRHGNVWKFFSITQIAVS